MIMDEKKLMKIMGVSLDNHLTDMIEIFTKTLDENNHKYNNECVQLSADKKTLFVSSLGSTKETLIKFNQSRVFLIIDENSTEIKTEDLSIEKSITNTIAESYIVIKNKNSIFCSLKNNSASNKNESQNNSFREVLIKLIYVFLNYNMFKNMNKNNSEVSFG